MSGNPGGGGAGHRLIPLRPRAGLLLLCASALGVASLLWPLFIHAAGTANGAHAADAPWIFVALLPLLFGIVMAEIADGSLDAKAVAMLGIMAACGCVLRLYSPGAGGFEPVFFLLVVAGRVFGRGFGFVLGALTLFTSALLTGGIGPWLPFQMFAAGWVGFGAGCLPRARGRREVWVLAAYTAPACLLYGAVTDMWFWPFITSGAGGGPFAARPGAGVLTNLHLFAGFYVTTSLGFDLGRVVTNTVLVVLVGRPVLAALRRVARRGSFETPATVET